MLVLHNVYCLFLFYCLTFSVKSSFKRVHKIFLQLKNNICFEDINDSSDFFCMKSIVIGVLMLGEPVKAVSPGNS